MKKIQLNKKSIARIAAIQAIYQGEYDLKNFDLNGKIAEISDFYNDKDVNQSFDLLVNLDVKIKPSRDYFRQLVVDTTHHVSDINKLISSNLSDKWTLELLPRLLLAILQVAICELKYFSDIPRKVIINEYTNIANDMIDLQEIGFVNSILDKLSSD